MKLQSRCSSTYTVQNCPIPFTGGAIRQSQKMSSYLNRPSPSNYDACIPKADCQYSMNIQMIYHWTMNAVRLVTGRSAIMMVSWPVTTCRGLIPADSGAPRIRTVLSEKPLQSEFRIHVVLTCQSVLICCRLFINGVSFPP